MTKTSSSTKGILEHLKVREVELSRRVRDRSGLQIEAAADPLDQTIQLANRDTAAAELVVAKSDLDQVRAAIRRIKEGAYGICSVCDGEIAPKRLAALPMASSCITCASSGAGR